MKIKQIHLEKFKRFTDLTIRDISQDVKLVVMLIVAQLSRQKSKIFIMN